MLGITEQVGQVLIDENETIILDDIDADQRIAEQPLQKAVRLAQQAAAEFIQTSHQGFCLQLGQSVAFSPLLFKSGKDTSFLHAGNMSPVGGQQRKRLTN